jgi:hypothetical protein
MSDTYLINYLRTNYQDKNGKITESAVQQCEDALKSKGVQVNYNQLVGGLDRREFTKNPVQVFIPMLRSPQRTTPSIMTEQWVLTGLAQVKEKAISPMVQLPHHLARLVASMPSLNTHP